PRCRSRRARDHGRGDGRPGGPGGGGLRRGAVHGLRVRDGPGQDRVVALRHSGHPAPLRRGRPVPRAIHRIMNVSYRWLTALAPGLADSPERVADRPAMYGAPVDEVVHLGEPLADIVVARVTGVRRHPNADRLSLCEVDAGTGETLPVVCGAPNVQVGSFYPFAPVGARLPGGVAIRRAKIRGEESQGMLCSERELGLGRDHSGIMELRGDFRPGESFVSATGMDDVRFVVDVTPNRPDLLSHWGIAREL